MYRLGIVCVFDPSARVPPYMFNDEKRIFDFQLEEDAVERALEYLKYSPNDIVMLLEYTISVCKNCHEAIEEVPGWVLHQWVHRKTNAYACVKNSGATQAEPIFE